MLRVLRRRGLILAGGGTWRFAACTDYWSKYELGWHLSLTANQHDAIAAVEAAIGEAEMLAGRPLIEQLTDTATGEIVAVSIVTDNGGPFRAARFAAFIAARDELQHVRTRVSTPGQNGVRERGFESLKYERLYREHIPDGLALAAHTEDYRVKFNTVRPHEALAWNRQTRQSTTLTEPDLCHLLDAGQALPSIRTGPAAARRL